jgi:hypothetical protein
LNYGVLERKGISHTAKVDLMYIIHSACLLSSSDVAVSIPKRIILHTCSIIDSGEGENKLPEF